MDGRPKCPDCGAPEGVILEVSSTGFSCTSGYEHLSDCPQLRCKHGILWADNCEECNAQSRAESMDEDDPGEASMGDQIRIADGGE
jgi:hypothetical protein